MKKREKKTKCCQAASYGRVVTGTYKKGMAAVLSIALLLSIMPGTLSHAKTKKPVINHKKLVMTVGQTKNLKVKYISKKSKVQWTSSKKKIVTVTKKGKVKAKAAGKAVIIAKAGKKKYRCTITVKAKKMKASTNATNENAAKSPQFTIQPVEPAFPISPTVSQAPETTAKPDNSTSAPDSMVSAQPDVTQVPAQTDKPDSTQAPDITAEPEETEEPEETDRPYPSLEPDEEGIQKAVAVEENVSAKVTFAKSTEEETSYSYVKFVPAEDGLYRIKTDILETSSDQENTDSEKIEVVFGTKDNFSADQSEEEIAESCFEFGDYSDGECIDLRPHTILKANVAYYMRVNTSKTYETAVLITKNAFPTDAQALSTSKTTTVNVSQYCSNYYLDDEVVEAGHEGYITFTPDRDGYYQFRQAVSDYDDVTTEQVYPVYFKIFKNGTDCLARQDIFASGEIDYEEEYTQASEYISYKCLEKMSAGTTYYIALEDQRAGDITMSVVKYDVPGFSDTVSTNLSLTAGETTRIIFTPSQTGYYKFSTVSKMTSGLQVEIVLNNSESVYTYVGESLALDWLAEYVKFKGGQKYYIDFTSDGTQMLQTLKAERFDAESLENAIAKKVNVKFGQDTILKFTPAESAFYQITSAENCYVDMDCVIYDTMPDYDALNGETQLEEITGYYATAGDRLEWELDESLEAGQTYYIVLSAGTDDNEQYLNQNMNLTISKYVDDSE